MLQPQAIITYKFNLSNYPPQIPLPFRTPVLIPSPQKNGDGVTASSRVKEWMSEYKASWLSLYGICLLLKGAGLAFQCS